MIKSTLFSKAALQFSLNPNTRITFSLRLVQLGQINVQHKGEN
jgi:hypothetical protein